MDKADSFSLWQRDEREITALSHGALRGTARAEMQQQGSLSALPINLFQRGKALSGLTLM